MIRNLGYSVGLEPQFKATITKPVVNVADVTKKAFYKDVLTNVDKITSERNQKAFIFNTDVEKALRLAFKKLKKSKFFKSLGRSEQAETIKGLKMADEVVALENISIDSHKPALEKMKEFIA